MRPRTKRLLLVAIAVAALAATGLVPAAPASALDLEPFVTFLDHGAQVADASTEALDGMREFSHDFGDSAVDMESNRALLGFEPEHEPPTSQETLNQTDWCYWAALVRSAGDIVNQEDAPTDGSQRPPAQLLFDNLTACLDLHLASGESSPQIDPLARTLVFINEVKLVESQLNLTAQQAEQWLQVHSLNPALDGWINWYAYAARTVPPIQ